MFNPPINRHTLYLAFTYWRVKSSLIHRLYRGKDKSSKRELDSIKVSANSFQDKHRQLSSRLVWKADRLSKGGDYIELPQTTWRRGGADCDGLANLMYYVFGDTINYVGDTYSFAGFRAYIAEESHVVAVWESKDYYLVLDNLDRRKMIKEEYEKFVKSHDASYEVFMDSKWRWIKCEEVK